MTSSWRKAHDNSPLVLVLWHYGNESHAVKYLLILMEFHPSMLKNPLITFRQPHLISTISQVMFHSVVKITLTLQECKLFFSAKAKFVVFKWRILHDLTRTQVICKWQGNYHIWDKNWNEKLNSLKAFGIYSP